MRTVDLDACCTQTLFSEIVGLNQSTVSRLLDEAIIGDGGTLVEWITDYCHRLREMAAGRQGTTTGGLDLVQERAALARSQRIAQDMKNAVSRGEFAPIGLLADVLAAAGSGLVDRFDQVEGTLRKSCPDLPHEAVEVILSILASARNEWISSTQRLVIERLDAMTTDEDDGEEDPLDDDDGGVT